MRPCGGGGDVGCDEYSVIRIWVMYVSITADRAVPLAITAAPWNAAHRFKRPASFRSERQLWNLLTGAIGIFLAEAAVDDAAFLIFESLGAADGRTRASPVCAVHYGAVLRS